MDIYDGYLVRNEAGEEFAVVVINPASINTRITAVLSLTPDIRQDFFKVEPYFENWMGGKYDPDGFIEDYGKIFAKRRQTATGETTVVTWCGDEKP